MSSESSKVLEALHEVKVANINPQREKGVGFGMFWPNIPLGHHILFHKLDLNFIKELCKVALEMIREADLDPEDDPDMQPIDGEEGLPF